MIRRSSARVKQPIKLAAGRERRRVERRIQHCCTLPSTNDRCFSRFRATAKKKAVYVPISSASSAVVANPRFEISIERFSVRVEDYEKLKKIECGAFGGIYSAQHQSPGATATLKELAPAPTDTRERESYREVLMLATRKHPGILTLRVRRPGF
jgi:serine/threonine protein kinase